MVDASARRVADIDASLHELRRLLGGPIDERVDVLEHRVDGIDRQISDDDLLVARLVPIFDLLMQRMVREHRDVLVESMYPVIGALINRAVREAIANLAQRIDAQARRATDLRRIGWRLRAMLGGADAREAALRERLPFDVEEVLLIHRASGLLLLHEAAANVEAADRDLVAGMLTAIRAVAEESFAAASPEADTGLDEVHVGERRLLLEADRHVVLAVVVDGIEPSDYRERMRSTLSRLRGSHGRLFAEFEGDMAAFSDTTPMVWPLFEPGVDPGDDPPGGRGETAALVVAAIVLAALACSSFWALRWTFAALVPSASAPPAAAPTALAVASRDTVAPSTRTSVPVAPATAAPATRRPPAPRLTAYPDGNVWLRSRPDVDVQWRLRTVGRSTPVELLARSRDGTAASEDSRWLWVRLPESEEGPREGWMRRAWVLVEDKHVSRLPIADESSMGEPDDDE